MHIKFTIYIIDSIINTVYMYILHVHKVTKLNITKLYFLYISQTLIISKHVTSNTFFAIHIALTY